MTIIIIISIIIIIIITTTTVSLLAVLLLFTATATATDDEPTIGTTHITRRIIKGIVPIPGGIYTGGTTAVVVRHHLSSCDWP